MPLESTLIEGAGAADIVASVRSLVARGALEDGTVLPPVRVLAERLALNRNTVATAYRQLAERGVVEGRGRGGTVIASSERLRGEGAGRPSRPSIWPGQSGSRAAPDLRAAFAAVAYDPPLYGAPGCAGTSRARRGSLLRTRR